MIIGIAGTNASGKDELAQYLRDEHGFLISHTSDYIRTEAKKRYGNILRPTLFKVGNELRQEGGAGVLADIGVKEYRESKNDFNGVAISSIRTLGEVEVIHAAKGKMVFLDASRLVRYQRIQKRMRADDKVSYETFVEHEEAELFESDDPAKFNILGVKEQSDILIMNEGTVENFLSNAVLALGL